MTIKCLRHRLPLDTARSLNDILITFDLITPANINLNPLPDNGDINFRRNEDIGQDSAYNVNQEYNLYWDERRRAIMDQPNHDLPVVENLDL